ncbi:hypothetical protein TeGR_g6844, partial [Tetraparma gracilis]
HERIVTTTQKAKTVAPVAEKLITLAKLGTLASIQRSARFVREKAMVTKLHGVLGPRYEDRHGGYTRVLKVSGHRQGDAADMSVVEFVGRTGEMRPARPGRPQGRGLKDVVDEYRREEEERIGKGLKVGEKGLERTRHPGLAWLW